MQVIRLGFGPDYVDYQRAWDLQRELHAKVVAGEEPDTALLLSTPPVYTAGKRTEPHERPLDGTPVIDVDRGGKITWHGPARSWGTRSSGCPSRSTSSPTCGGSRTVMIGSARLGVDATRVEGRSGDVGARRRRATAPSGRSARIGIRVSQSVTMHGFALNCDNDLAGPT